MAPFDNLVEGFNGLLCGTTDNKEIQKSKDGEADDMALLYSPPLSPKEGDSADGGGAADADG
eukprot:CAMPEP_0173456568 /NCGR_PEP_ID=MMETSP1357-20121228/56267_1 /TAXON_ID=77926 /ORGANISM="Hemiselmis rufescens, Strain PCC563" /LENGTH=61 /DNA_ID=CAMNT_0014423807 /DNA_START=1 /DNA_END=183 /DNA_ORIENTATION=-